jgi:hypothetical protein
MKSFFKEFCGSFLGVLILLSTSFIAYAQTGLPLEKVEISISEPFLNMKSVPFDVPFYIEVEGLSNNTSIQFQYGLKYKKDREKSWITLPTILKTDSLYRSDFIIAKDGKAVFYCPGLHPNMPYVFRLIRERELSDDISYRKDLKDKIANTIVVFTKRNAQEDITPDELERLFKEIDSVIYLHVAPGATEELIRKSNKEKYATNYKDHRLTYDVLRNGYKNINLKNGTIQGKYGAQIVFDTLNKYADSFLLHLNGVKRLTSNSNEHVYQVEDSIGYTPKEFASYSLKDKLELLRSIIIQPDQLQKILIGKSKIEEKQFVPTETYDFPTIYTILGLVKDIRKGRIKYTEQGENKILFQGDSSFIAFADVLDGLNNEYHSIDTSFSNIQKGIDAIKDVTIELLISESITTDAILMPDVETEKSPYFSIETGLGWAIGYPSAFHYYVMNFYFVPVNKRAPFTSFKGKNCFLKMFSVQVGFANFLGKRPEYTYSVLGDNTKWNLMLGAGLRVTKILKINAGMLLTKTNENNPLLDKYTFKPSFYTSLGVDIDFFKAVNNVADFFKP